MRPCRFRHKCALALLFPQQARDRRAQFGDAGAVVGRGGEDVREGGRAFGERRLDLGDALAKLGRLHRVGLGEHDLIADRRLAQHLEGRRRRRL